MTVVLDQFVPTAPADTVPRGYNSAADVSARNLAATAAPCRVPRSGEPH
jgi:hypothetical protein